MSLTVVVRMKAKPDEEKRLGAELAALVPPTVAEPGCLSYRPYVDPDDPSAWILVEEWTDPDAFDRHLQTPHLAHTLEVFEHILAEPLSLRRFTEVV